MEDIIKIYPISPPGLMREDRDESDIDKMPIGMAYVPRQVWRNKYENDKALMRGTLFAELDKPFMGAKR